MDKELGDFMKKFGGKSADENRDPDEADEVDDDAARHEKENLNPDD